MTLLDRWQGVMMNNYGTPPLALASGEGAMVERLMYADTGRNVKGLICVI